MNLNKCIRKKCKDCKSYVRCFKDDNEGRCEQLKSMQKGFINQQNGSNVETLILQH